MARRYVGVPTVGKPVQIFEKILHSVKRHKLTRLIPVVKFEKKARGQFYVFLAVEGAEGTRLPECVVTVLQDAGLRGMRHWPLKPDEVKPMTGQAELETHSLNALVYKSLWSNDAGDPFDLSEATVSEGHTADPELGKRYDQLLYWLSATAEGTWQTFAQVCHTLQLVHNATQARHIFRRLMLLGDIESSDNGLKWSICPMALVQSATDTNTYFLSGQRTPKLLEQLAAHWAPEKRPQPEDQGPPCLIVRDAPPIDVTVDGIQIKQAGVAALRLAHLLPDLTGWKETLASLDRISTAHDRIEIWNGERFVPCQRFYERDGRYVGDAGMYRLTRGEGANAYQQVLYFDPPNQRWLRGDWYGLRFLAHDTANVDIEVTYDSSTRNLRMLADERWPLLYERALVLASGMLPCRAENLRWFKYSGISAELIHVLAQKLNVSVREV